MAITYTVLADDPDTAGADSYASPAVTPAGSTNVIVAVASAGTLGTTNPALTVPSWLDGAWTLEIRSPDTSIDWSIWSGKTVASPSSAAVTVNFTSPVSDPQTGCHIVILQVDGADTADPVIQVEAFGEASNTTGTVTLDNALGDSNNHVLGFFCHATNEVHTPAGGATELMDNGYSSPNRRVSAQYELDDGTETTSCTWTTASLWHGIALEIKSASTGPISQEILQVTETDLAQAVTSALAGTIGQVTETDLAQAVAAALSLAILQVEEIDFAQPMGNFLIGVIGQVEETDTAQQVTAIIGGEGRMAAAGLVYLFGDTEGVVVPIGQVTETDLAQAVTVNFPVFQTIGQVTETDTAQAVVVVTPLIFTINQVTETDEALRVTRKVVVGQRYNVKLWQRKRGRG